MGDAGAIICTGCDPNANLAIRRLPFNEIPFF